MQGSSPDSEKITLLLLKHRLLTCKLQQKLAYCCYLQGKFIQMNLKDIFIQMFRKDILVMLKEKLAWSNKHIGNKTLTTVLKNILDIDVVKIRKKCKLICANQNFVACRTRPFPRSEWTKCFRYSLWIAFRGWTRARTILKRRARKLTLFDEQVPRITGH